MAPLIVALLLTPASASSADTITGRASVIDGDTIEIAGNRLRLHGVDAPKAGRLVPMGTVAPTVVARLQRVPLTGFWPLPGPCVARSKSAIGINGSSESVIVPMAVM